MKSLFFFRKAVLALSSPHKIDVSFQDSQVILLAVSLQRREWGKSA